MNPYMNYSNMPMPMNMNMQIPMYGKQEVIKVNGENSARSFQMPPNSSALLLDENQPLVYLVTTDGAGYKTVNLYSITPYEPETPVSVKDLESRIAKLEEMISNGKSNNSNAKRTESSKEP